jgi:hypothetical protein
LIEVLAAYQELMNKKEEWERRPWVIDVEGDGLPMKGVQ